jgi:hypothetical protein
LARFWIASPAADLAQDTRLTTVLIVALVDWRRNLRDLIPVKQKPKPIKSRGFWFAAVRCKIVLRWRSVTKPPPWFFGHRKRASGDDAT